MAKSAPRPPKTDDDVDFAVPLKDAVDPLVLALDVGSTATRGSLHDATGTPVRGYRDKIPHQFTTAADGTSTIDPGADLGSPIAFTLPDFAMAGPQPRADSNASTWSSLGAGGADDGGARP